MSVATPSTAVRGNALTAGMLPKRAPWMVLAISLVVSALVFLLIKMSQTGADFNIVGTVIVAAILYAVILFTSSLLVEGIRKAKDRLAFILITGAFLIALVPLISLLWTTVVNGLPRFDALFFSSSMRNVVGEGGGGLHAIMGTLIVTGWAALISIPVGLLTAIYLVEYGKGRIAKAVTFLVDVMTGIPSIVAGLAAYALFVLLAGPGVRMGFGGAVALSLLMIPVVVRSSEEMLKLVPNELREASYALGVPKWLTIVKVVLPTSIAGIITGVMIAISRVIGETAPLLIISGFTQSMNYDAFNERMMTLPVFVYTQYANQGIDPQANLDRAWTGALVLILIVMILNLSARLIAKAFSPKLGR